MPKFGSLKAFQNPLWKLFKMILKNFVNKGGVLFLSKKSANTEMISAS